MTQKVYRSVVILCARSYFMQVSDQPCQIPIRIWNSSSISYVMRSSVNSVPCMIARNNGSMCHLTSLGFSPMYYRFAVLSAYHNHCYVKNQDPYLIRLIISSSCNTCMNSWTFYPLQTAACISKWTRLHDQFLLQGCFCISAYYPCFGGNPRPYFVPVHNVASSHLLPAEEPTSDTRFLFLWKTALFSRLMCCLLLQDQHKKSVILD